MRHEMVRKTAVACGSILLLDCAHHRPPPVATVPDEGRTSVRVLNAPATPSDGAVEAQTERLTPAYASPDNRLPDYPPVALKAGCRRGLVAVRVHIDPDGNVTAQRDVPGHPLPADECHMAFRASVQSAINTWRFAPAFRQTPIVDAATDARAPVLHWRQEPIAIYLDFEFTFDVVAGKGIVRSR